MVELVGSVWGERGGGGRGCVRVLRGGRERYKRPGAAGGEGGEWFLRLCRRNLPFVDPVAAAAAAGHCQTAVVGALKEAVLRVLTPTKSTDLLHEVQAHRGGRSVEGRPYVCAFVGINGVGKSTSLAKVCYYLKSHGVKVRQPARGGGTQQAPLGLHVGPVLLGVLHLGWTQGGKVFWGLQCNPSCTPRQETPSASLVHVTRHRPLLLFVCFYAPPPPTHTRARAGGGR